MFCSLATGKGVQQYLLAVNMLEGVINREQLNEVWGAVESRYFPRGPSVKNDPLEFLCYLLSTSTVETFIENILKTGAEVVSQIRKVDFQELQYGVAARVDIFYWDRFLEYTESPEFDQKYEQAEKAFVKLDAVVSAPIWEKLTEMDMFPAITRLLYRVNIITAALAKEEEFQTFRGDDMKHLKSLNKEAKRVLEEEKENTTVILLPQVRAGVRLFSNYSNQLIDKNIDDSDAEQLAKKLEKMRKICTKKLLASGPITQEELEESER
ncbi:uncharacterized protein LOC118804917 [Colossoma macropomum]|uniref:uncharacterized protein LOC118804917 n=1 Tax=Colossoma macropomum TaxID=42526 RepID=UPI001864413A|nr:uncharacterized protein LOC118804917 [Colossoma macropomum]